jgi:hypothetical protein
LRQQPLVIKSNGWQQLTRLILCVMNNQNRVVIVKKPISILILVENFRK